MRRARAGAPARSRRATSRAWPDRGRGSAWWALASRASAASAREWPRARARRGFPPLAWWMRPASRAGRPWRARSSATSSAPSGGTRTSGVPGPHRGPPTGAPPWTHSATRTRTRGGVRRRAKRSRSVLSASSHWALSRTSRTGVRAARVRSTSTTARRSATWSRPARGASASRRRRAMAVRWGPESRSSAAHGTEARRAAAEASGIHWSAASGARRSTVSWRVAAAAATAPATSVLPAPAGPVRSARPCAVSARSTALISSPCPTVVSAFPVAATTHSHQPLGPHSVPLL